MNDFSDLLNITPPPSLIEWCEKNVQIACQALSADVKIYAREETGNDIKVEAVSQEYDLGEATSVKKILTEYAAGYTNIWYAEQHDIPATMSPKAARTLESIAAHIKHLLVTYPIDQDEDE